MYYVDLVPNLLNSNNFTKLPENDITVEHQKTLEGKLFIHLDTGMDNPDRIVVFTTDENIEYFYYSEVVVCYVT